MELKFDKIEMYIRELMERSGSWPCAWNINDLRRGKEPNFNYTDCLMALALIELGDVLKEPVYLDFVLSYMDRFVSEDGNISAYKRDAGELDDILGGRVLLLLYERTGKEKYLYAAGELRNSLRMQPRNSEGSYWHKVIYPDQVWLDGIYMALPFQAMYDLSYAGGDLSDVIRQVENVRRNMLDMTTGLYYHGYDASRRVFWADKVTGLSRGFWLRSIGWFAMALADLCDILPLGKHRDSLIPVYRELMHSVSAYMDDESGMYYQLPDRRELRGNYLEVSGSSMLAYAMLKGAFTGVLSHEYEEYGLTTFFGIIDRYFTVSSEGGALLGGICLTAGLGPEGNRKRDGSDSYYLSESVVSDDGKGVAPFLMCYALVLRHLKSGDDLTGASNRHGQVELL